MMDGQVHHIPSRRLRQLERLFADMRHTHTLDDVLHLIDTGLMQSFAVNESWAVTSITVFPRKSVLEVFMVVGDDADMPELEDKVQEFARSLGVTLIRAYGREGWARRAEARGWKVGPRIYVKELSDGRWQG